MQSSLVVKPRDVPIEVLKAEALSRRLAGHHYMKKEVNQKAKNLRAGLNGEESLDFILSFIQDDSCRILHNLRIRDYSEYFQIDNLILSPKFILINEVKNIAGTVMYDTFGQAIRISKNGEEENLGNHIEQVNLQHLRLLNWMRQYNFPAIPIEKLVIYSSSSTIIKNPGNNKTVDKTVIHKEELLTKISELSKKHKSAVFSEEHLNQLSAHLIDAHTPKKIDIMENFSVDRKELLCGVFCPGCGALPMARIKGGWICPKCQLKSKNAHIPALQHYNLLFGNKINNREAREFLKVDSSHVIKRIFRKEAFESTGNTTKRVYCLPFY
ncbi:Nuclease-related domain-containing protein [Lentibacillus halodurans]|uniref:Nuclease-related domain-containing protein n=1 Tax=Lentibacillus halodurans TaxID=237679 RepID=A0A1I0ZTB2_9BACI|nr:NERD domain-containing protein [Lentibacillus halodurans]SFB28741.1 Nuclease-related domain-containing protein [Lentibacillus halodurans]